MKNASWFARAALCVSLRGARGGFVAAIKPFAPVGYFGGVWKAGESAPLFWVGGEAVLGQTPVMQDTVFRIASISKMVGGAAAMRLVGRGLLALDTNIAETLGFPIRKCVTLRQLLTHTAALSDAAVYDRVILGPSPPPLSELLDQSFLPYEPGTRFRYSNLGAGVAGMLVEKASGMLFDDFVRREFFAPYGVDASFHPQRILRRERMANCYRVPGSELAYDAHAIAELPMDDMPNPEAHYSVPAGRLMIAGPELLSLLRRLREQDAEIFAPQDFQGSVTCSVGRGLGVALAGKGVFSASRSFAGHQGSAYGAGCQAWIDLSDGTTAVFLTNGVRLSSIGPLQKAGQRGIGALIREADGASPESMATIKERV